MEEGRREGEGWRMEEGRREGKMHPCTKQALLLAICVCERERSGGESEPRNKAD